MKKQDFIAALYRACPEFRRDLEEYESFYTNADSGSGPIVEKEDESKSLEKQREFIRKWPRLHQTYPLRLSLEQIGCSRLMSPSHYLAMLAQVEIDPNIRLSEMIQLTIAGHKKFPKELHDERGTTVKMLSVAAECFANDKKLQKRGREWAGDRLFSAASIVIPVYPETTKDDIDWEIVEKLKKQIYGQSYRPKPDQYEKIVKVFEMGQLLEEGKAYKSWQEVADSVGLGLNTIRYIYSKAHELVYGFSPKKRHYRTPEEVTIPESPQEVPEDPGPKLKERLLNSNKEIDSFNNEGDDDDEIGSFKALFEETDQEDDDQDGSGPEKCHKCQRFLASSSGEYMPHPSRENVETFLCRDCLSPSD